MEALCIICPTAIVLVAIIALAFLVYKDKI